VVSGLITQSIPRDHKGKCLGNREVPTPMKSKAPVFYATPE
jgi:hypothetical protein